MRHEFQTSQENGFPNGFETEINLLKRHAVEITNEFFKFKQKPAYTGEGWNKIFLMNQGVVTEDGERSTQILKI